MEGAVVTTATEQIRAKKIVGADGPNSIVSASVPGFSPNRALCHCSFVLAEGDFREEILELWFGKEWQGGYFWVFPKGRLANIGLGVRNGRSPRALLDAALYSDTMLNAVMWLSDQWGWRRFIIG